MAEHDALGLSGGARRVDQRREVVRSHRQRVLLEAGILRRPRSAALLDVG